MAYTLSKTNNQVLLVLNDGEGNGPSFPVKTTSINFIGKNYSNFGDAQNENFLWLLENFANTTQPNNPLTGQIWFNSNPTVNRPSVFDGNNWKALATLQYSNTTTDALINNGTIPYVANYPGDMWFDSSSKQLYVITSTGTDKTLIGPEGVPGFGITKMSSTVMYDTLNGKHPVIQATVNGEIIGVVSSSTFSSNVTNFNTVYKGLTFTPGSSLSVDTIWSTTTNASTLVAGQLLADNANLTAITAHAISADTINVSTITSTILTAGTAGTAGTLTGQWKLTAGSQFAPATNLANDLGTAALKFNNVYANNLSASNLTGTVTLNGIINPSTTDSQDFGTNSLRWNRVYTKSVEATTLNATTLNATNVSASGTLNGALAMTSMVDLFSNTINRFDVDGTFTRNSDSILPSQKSIKTYVDTAITNLSNSLLDTIAALQNQLANVSSVVAGTIFYTANSVVPNGYLLCNGAFISTTSYADLFAAIGYTYGGAGPTFRLPDLRGEFIRGTDAGRGIDIGRTPGSFQDHLVVSHNHSITLAGNTAFAGEHSHTAGSTLNDPGHNHLMPGDDQLGFANGYAGWPARSNGGFPYDAISNHGGGGQVWLTSDAGTGITVSTSITDASNHAHGISLSGLTTSQGGAETRPRNVALTPIIKI